ncbi:Uncharacterised protein [Mycobacteroides abscessus subsp. massiliense]|nr:Uncharacterised protein [Mycobacteroides abscessus subsp. massiliense]
MHYVTYLGGSLLLLKGGKSSVSTGSKDLAKVGGTIKKGGKSVKQFYKSPVNRYTPALEGILQDAEHTINVKNTPLLKGIADSTKDRVLFKSINGKSSKNKAVKKGLSKKSREVALPKVDTYEQARNEALNLIGDLGIDSKPFIGTLSKSAGFGKVTGRMSEDNKVLWRLDYDPEKGPHINVEDYRNGKGDKAKKYYIPFNGNEDTYKSLLKHLNK